jgi:hypothetical protein
MNLYFETLYCDLLQAKYLNHKYKIPELIYLVSLYKDWVDIDWRDFLVGLLKYE